MGLGTKLLQSQPCLAERAGRSGTDILAEDGKRLPQGKGLESQNPLRICTLSHRSDERQIPSQFLLPLPGTFQHLFGRSLCLPAQHLVGLVDIAPYLLDIAFTTRSIGPIDLDTCGFFEALHHLECRKALARADVEHLNGIRLRFVEYALHSLDMGFGQVDNIDIVTDAGLIGRIVVVAENLQLLTNTHSRLGYERY